MLCSHDECYDVELVDSRGDDRDVLVPSENITIGRSFSCRYMFQMYPLMMSHQFFGGEDLVVLLI